MTSPAGRVVWSTHRDTQIGFFVQDEHDAIQSHHAQGRFYDVDELALLQRYIKAGAVVLDVGANVGNHALFIAKLLDPQRVILIEPNPVAIAVLRATMELNQLSAVVDMALLGIGLSDRAGWAVAKTPIGNLGGTRLHVAPQDGGIRLVAGDDLLGGKRIDFIKMDVEGMEMQALAGLRAVIAANRPGLYVEVDNRNRTDFFAYVEAQQYVVKERHKIYRDNENFLMLPRERN